MGNEYSTEGENSTAAYQSSAVPQHRSPYASVKEVKSNEVTVAKPKGTGPPSAEAKGVEPEKDTRTGEKVSTEPSTEEAKVANSEKSVGNDSTPTEAKVDADADTNAAEESAPPLDTENRGKIDGDEATGTESDESTKREGAAADEQNGAESQASVRKDDSNAADGKDSASAAEATQDPASEGANENQVEEAYASTSKPTQEPTEAELTENPVALPTEDDPEVLRAQALALLVAKYPHLTPEQLSNITPEQIARLSHTSVSAKPIAPMQPSLSQSSLSASTEAATPRRKHPARPIVELREYELHPMYAHSYLHHTSTKADLRKSLTPLRLFAVPETGGTLNIATHFYYWRGGYDERNARRVDMATSDEWKEYIKKVQPALARQRSTIFVEAALEGCVGLAMGRGEKMLRMGTESHKECIYEVCRYKLKLGYDIIPSFLASYREGLPSKLKAEGTDPTTSLISLMYSTVGMLNEVIEIWRHGGGAEAMERSGAAAHRAAEWRTAGEKIAELTVEVSRTLYKPLVFSPLR